ERRFSSRELIGERKSELGFEPLRNACEQSRGARPSSLLRSPINSREENRRSVAAVWESSD
ncbi:MAG: hypothetical protein AAFV77_14000, partial [Planctomycetota bacterium]